MDSDEEVHYCKKCDKVLEEGRAYELGGNRWHVECFTCSSCDALLDCDTNLLVLGNGSLICNNCSYRCQTCHKKIEDLAILTGDQAYCSECFCCRNCKKKIEDLRYARTFQGIFCMSCHETLLARKKRTQEKRTRHTLHQRVSSTNTTTTRPGVSHQHSGSSVNKSFNAKALREKSLPSIPTEDGTEPKSSPPPLPPPDHEQQRPIQRQSMANGRLNLMDTNRNSMNFSSSGNTMTVTESYHERNDSDSSRLGFLPIKLDESSVPITLEAPPPPKRPDESSTSYFTLEVPPARPTSAMSNRSNRSFKINEKSIHMDDSESLNSVSTTDEPISNGELGPPANLDPPTFTKSKRPHRIERKKVPEPLKLESTNDNMDQLIPERSVLRSTSPVRPEHSAPTAAAPSTPTSTGSTELKRSSTISKSSPRSPRSPRSPSVRASATAAAAAAAAARPSPRTQETLISLPNVRHTSLTLSDDLSPFMSSSKEEDDDFQNNKRASTTVSVAPPDSSSSLANELIESKKRIADLERLLSEKDQSSLEQDLQEKRKTIAGLQAQQVISKKELEALSSESNRVESGEIVTQFKDQIIGFKNDIQTEITNLLAQRDALKAEVEELSTKRDNIVKESSILNLKNTQLADMNNELTKQLIDKFGPQGLNGSNSKISTSGSMNNLDSITHSPAVGALSSSHSGPINAPHEYGHEPVVTVLEAGQVVDTRKDRQHARRFWKRPGAAVAKGLNKVFATEESPGHHHHQGNANGQQNNTNNAPNSLTNSVTDLTQENGLGISFPKDNQKSKSRNNWFKSGGDHHNSSTTTSNSQQKSNTTPEEKPADALMGNSIEKRVQFEGTTVPILVKKCIEEVENRGIDFEGIYRKSGGKSQISQIEEVFEKCQESKYEEVLSGDIAGVTSALKQYLRYLPVPLITFDAYDEFIKATENSSKEDVSGRIDRLRKVVESLPAAHRDTLEILMKHLSKVTQYAETNLMNARNVAVVFAPTIARHTTGEREILDMQPRNDGTQMMVEHCDAIFGESPAPTTAANANSPGFF